MSMLEIKDLQVSYGGIEALRGISLNVDQNEIVTLIGANGAVELVGMNDQRRALVSRLDLGIE